LEDFLGETDMGDESFGEGFGQSPAKAHETSQVDSGKRTTIGHLRPGSNLLEEFELCEVAGKHGRQVAGSNVPHHFALS
jgi:hypothetical protein